MTDHGHNSANVSRIPSFRDPAHEPIDWFETDYDDQFDDPDEPDYDPLPTERHRRVPGFTYGG